MPQPPAARRPSDRRLLRWLRTGRPRSLDAAIAGDPELGERVDALTALSEQELGDLVALARPAPGFGDRTRSTVIERATAAGTTAAVLDLLGLGFRTGSAVAGPALPLQKKSRDPDA